MHKIKIIAATALIAPLSLSAETQKDRLDTLMLKPLPGQLISKTSYYQADKEFNELNSSFTAYDAKTLTDKNYTEILDYGINEKLNIFTILEYSKEETSTKGSSSVEDYDGFENPIFALKYRQFNLEDHGFDFDIMLPISFDLVDSEAADASSHVTGTVADGRDTIALRLDLGKYYGDFGILFGAGVEYKDDKSTYNSSTNSNDTASSSTDYSYGVELQYVQAVYSVNLNLTKQNLGSYRDENNYKYSFDTVTAYSIKLNYSPKPSDYLFSFKYENIDAGNLGIDSASLSGNAYTDIEYEAYTLMYTYSF